MIEVEFGWQIRPFEYIHLKASSDSIENIEAEMVRKLRDIHVMGSAVISGSPVAAAPVANPDRVTVDNMPKITTLFGGTEAKVETITVSAEDLIKDELGGKVVETTTVVPPWQREKPAATVDLFA